MRRIAFWLSLLLVFVIPWENIIQIEALGTLGRITGIVVAGFWVATVVVTGRFRELRLFHGAVFLFVVWSVVTVFWSVDFEDTMSSLVTNIQLFGLILILWDLYTTPAALKAALQAYVLGAYVSIGSIVTNHSSGTTALWQRYSATGFVVDDIGVILALGLPLAWYLAISKSDGKMARILRLVNYGYIPAALLGIALTGTRTALVAASPAFLYAFGSLTQLKLAARVLIFVAVVTALFAVQSYIPQSSFDRLSTTGSTLADGDLNGRVTLWVYGLRAFVERPLIGYGSGTFRVASGTGRVAHNSWISIMVEEGMIGLVLFVTVVVMAFRKALRQPKWEARFWLSVLMVWILGASDLTWEPQKQTWLFLSLAVVSASLYARRGRRAPDPKFPQLERAQASWNGLSDRTPLARGAVNRGELAPQSRASSSLWSDNRYSGVQINAAAGSGETPPIGKRQ